MIRYVGWCCIKHVCILKISFCLWVSSSEECGGGAAGEGPCGYSGLHPELWEQGGQTSRGCVCLPSAWRCCCLSLQCYDRTDADCSWGEGETAGELHSEDFLITVELKNTLNTVKVTHMCRLCSRLVRSTMTLWAPVSRPSYWRRVIRVQISSLWVWAACLQERAPPSGWSTSLSWLCRLMTGWGFVCLLCSTLATSLRVGNFAGFVRSGDEV